MNLICLFSFFYTSRCCCCRVGAAVRKRFRSLANEKFTDGTSNSNNSNKDDQRDREYRMAPRQTSGGSNNDESTSAPAPDSYLAQMQQYRQGLCRDEDGQRPLMK
jgi:hypothetical protein